MDCVALTAKLPVLPTLPSACNPATSVEALLLVIWLVAPVAATEVLPVAAIVPLLLISPRVVIVVLPLAYTLPVFCMSFCVFIWA